MISSYTNSLHTPYTQPAALIHPLLNQSPSYTLFSTSNHHLPHTQQAATPMHPIPTVLHQYTRQLTTLSSTQATLVSYQR
jgi:hypothetical protein